MHAKKRWRFIAGWPRRSQPRSSPISLSLNTLYNRLSDNGDRARCVARKRRRWRFIAACTFSRIREIPNVVESMQEVLKL
jgi:hypothetical protein